MNWYEEGHDPDYRCRWEEEAEWDDARGDLDYETRAGK